MNPKSRLLTPNLFNKSRPVTDASMEKLTNDLLNTDWNRLNFTDNNSPADIHISCQQFISYLDSTYCKNFPLKIKYLSQKRLINRWVTPELKKLMAEKSIVFKNFKLGFVSREENNSFRNRVNIEVRKAKNEYFKNCFGSARCDMKNNLETDTKFNWH